ncbi:hypothetical protein Taro_001458 [Colocasia esculenta]|uniref:Uncharacterized protein n=1 Tax=Colocasia esculenta TaxID=4460 RepID=A0A843TB10_COLES|nr:hypothetical protein [Colocasia esculenta]
MAVDWYCWKLASRTMSSGMTESMKLRSEVIKLLLNVSLRISKCVHPSVELIKVSSEELCQLSHLIGHELPNILSGSLRSWRIQNIFTFSLNIHWLRMGVFITSLIVSRLFFYIRLLTLKSPGDSPRNQLVAHPMGSSDIICVTPRRGISECEAVATKRVLEYNQLIDHVGIHGQRRLTEVLNKDSLARQKEYPTESSSKSRERYNQLIDHVGIHGQRRLTEALNKDSLVWQKQYPMERSSKSRESVYIETSVRCSRGILEQWSVGNDIPKTS